MYIVFTTLQCKFLFAEIVSFSGLHVVQWQICPLWECSWNIKIQFCTRTSANSASKLSVTKPIHFIHKSQVLRGSWTTLVSCKALRIPIKIKSSSDHNWLRIAVWRTLVENMSKSVASNLICPFARSYTVLYFTSSPHTGNSTWTEDLHVKHKHKEVKVFYLEILISLLLYVPLVCIKFQVRQLLNEDEWSCQITQKAGKSKRTECELELQTTWKKFSTPEDTTN